MNKWNYWNCCGLSNTYPGIFTIRWLFCTFFWQSWWIWCFFLVFRGRFSCCSSLGFSGKSAGWLCPLISCRVVSWVGPVLFRNIMLHPDWRGLLFGRSVLRLWLVDFSDCFRCGLVGHWTWFWMLKKVSIWWRICFVSSNLEKSWFLSDQ